MMNDEPVPGTVTTLLRAARQGDAAARDELFRTVDAELRRLAQSMLNARGTRPDVVRGTELVNMACARLLGKDELLGEDRAHFFFLLGRAMHDVLVEEARRSGAKKRGAGRTPEPLLEVPVADGTSEFRMIELRDGLEALRSVDSTCAATIEMHFLGARSLRETAELLGLTLSEVRSHVAYGAAWLRARMEDGGG